ncbi:3' exoribonuclease family protein, putative [Cryptosporidium muris RN66]|uniref:3' exoribonuclease family protein, putative n=1 Tax=Cryptosporidium muris (strain RN66) TaxID=441375 RepID=B6AK41_CRYMR|nr:3' exoribonuclease family protein, putative [Cryptosporidium muris RN66]EEA08582.1 3' exoribonuclease family protein, putative [Cryptosporidium muris RN66]|eukprot:XP_002142931.1 3' exoribonuclease family protein [Cryptosporidium muris RN66]
MVSLSSFNEILNSEGFRIDGRRFNEIRRISCKISNGTSNLSDSSVYYEQGQTKLITSICGPIPLLNSSSQSGIQLHCNFRMSPFCTPDRRKRGKNDRFCTENSLIITRTFESAISEIYVKSQIIININVLEADGGVRSAAINATSLALANAGIGMKDLVISSTIGLYGRIPLYDIVQAEFDVLKTIMSFAIYSTDENIAPITMELNTKVDEDILNLLLEHSAAACKHISKILRNILRQHAIRRYYTFSLK